MYGNEIGRGENLRKEQSVFRQLSRLAYFSLDGDAANMIAAMLSSQSANVDGVSGAAYSSDGLKAAVRDALRKAREQ